MSAVFTPGGSLHPGERFVRVRFWFRPGDLDCSAKTETLAAEAQTMSPAAAFHAQLASIMEVLANTAVAEICELVDSGYAVLQLEISRSRKENEVLRRKLRLMELRAARANALRAAAAASGNASLTASARARAQLAAHHPGNEPRRNRPRGGDVVLSRVSPQDLSSDCGTETAQPVPAAAESTRLTTAVIKVEDEDEDESWARSEPDNGFCRVNEGQEMETNAPHLLPKRESSDEEHSSPHSWMSSEVSSTSTSLQKTLNTSQRSETDYDCLMFGSRTTQNPLSEDPSCSYALNNGVSVLADSGGSSFTFTVTEASLSVSEHQQPAALTDSQQRTPSAADEPQHTARKEVTDSQAAFIRRDGWRHQDGLNRADTHSREDAGCKSFVCNCCGKTLACLKNLKTHMRVHTGEKPFVCALCGKRFSDSSNLKRHQSVHTGEKRYGCIHCGKRFAQSGSLKVHMTVHTDCKQFRCSYCGKTFISGSHLRRHVTVHAGEKRFSPALP